MNKNDENDAFDEIQLLGKVPKRYLSKARKLLKVFDDHPEQITWNNDRVVFIDDVAIPDSDIALIFPRLFEVQQSVSSEIRGLQELILKIHLMGCGHLISHKHKTIISLDDISSDESESTPWYYIGL